LRALNEQWNGTAWTEIGDINTARQDLGGVGTSSLALASGGYSAGTNATEEWDATSTLAAGAWASGGSLPAAKQNMGAANAGTQSAMFSAGGTTTEEWTLIWSHSCFSFWRRT
jgi:hypothetical protein